MHRNRTRRTRETLHALAVAAVAVALGGGMGCVTTEHGPVPPHVNISPEDVDLAPAPGSGAAGVSIGIETEPNESDSLEELEALPGVRVTAVTRGGPAAAAGVRPGDVILRAAGVETNDPGALAAVLRRGRDGEAVELEVRRGTVVFQAAAVARATAAAVPPRELYRADPVRTRAGYRTALVEAPAADGTGAASVPGERAGGSTRAAAIVVRLFPESPLPDAGISAGDAILAIGGRAVASAQGLATTLLADHEPGDTVALEVLRRGERRPREVRVDLWEPRRRLAKLALLPLFRYESSIDPSRTAFSILDLWIVSLFSYERTGGEREYSIFSLIRFGTGQGELIEETGEGEGR